MALQANSPSLAQGAGPNIVNAPLIAERSIGIVPVAITPTAVAANSTADYTVAVPGVLPGDVVLGWAQTVAQAAGIVTGNPWVSAPDTVTIRYGNTTDASVTPTGDTLSLALFRPAYTVEPTSFSG